MVLGALVRLLISPMFVRMAAVALSAVTAFVLGLVVVRVLRRQMVEGSNISEDLGPETGNALYPYTAVIQQLKQQKFALENEKQVQQRRAKTSEHITASMISRSRRTRHFRLDRDREATGTAYQKQDRGLVFLLFSALQDGGTQKSLPDFHPDQPRRGLAVVLDLQLVVFGELDLASAIQ